jgi:GMP synthase (glutamine-hydrolysing)
MPHILIINNAEAGITEFAEPIEKIVSRAGSTFVFIEYKDCLSANFDDFDGIILTGSPQGDDIVEHHLPWFRWIKECEKPVLGICAGHHITGYLYGSELLRSIEPESGDFEVKIIKEDPVFKGIPNIFNVRQMHNDSITLPNDFELLATSETCKNQLMKHRSKPLYTCQFHPEFNNHKLILNFLELCKYKNHQTK